MDTAAAAAPHCDTPDLSDPVCYPHPVDRVQIAETHISRVFLTGDYAYKVKKRVALGFLDFTTLEARKRCCEDELRLNRRFAPALYLEVVAIRGSDRAPHVGGEGPVIDYAVKMREFRQEALASRLLASGALDARAIGDFAVLLADFHAAAPSDAGEYGTPVSVDASAQQNFDQIGALLTRGRDRAALARLHAWTTRELDRIRDVLARRHASGRVREVHGDLHLNNIVALDGMLTPFDCIEFSAALRWNDVMSEAAFLVMDLFDRDAAPLAWVFLDAYLARTGDYDGIAVLRYFLVYRALVRAKIHLMRAEQVKGDRAERRRLVDEYRRYAALATAFTRTHQRWLLMMHGLAGSGKSTVAFALLQSLHAFRLRSDVERKRLAHLPATAATHSAVGGGIYGSQQSEATYARLGELARTILGAGYPVIVDATFLRRRDRERLAGIAREHHAPWAIAEIEAPTEVLRHRVEVRAARGGDPSEATADVLALQLSTRETLAADERRRTVRIDGRLGLASRDEAALARKLSARPATSHRHGT